MLASPISLANLFDDPSFGVSSMPFNLPDNRLFNKTGAGLVIGYERGARLWRGTVQMVPLAQRDAKGIDAVMSYAQESGVSFFIYDRTCEYPRNDPTGSILGAANPLLNAVNANNRDVTISALPVGYVLSRGDMLSFTYAGRYALHSVVVGGTASAGGLATVHVTPAVRPGFTTGVAVKLVKPTMLAMLVPGSYEASVAQPGKVSMPASFDFMQTLRT